MKDIYPKKEEVKKPAEIDESVLAGRIIKAMENDVPKSIAIAECLAGTDNVEQFNKMWDMICDEGKEFRSVNPSKFNDETSFKDALNSKKKFLDVNKWVDCFKEESNSESFQDLKTKYSTNLI